MLLIKRLYEDVKIPVRAKDGDAGLDVFSRETKILNPNERYLFKLGFEAEFPSGYVCLVRPRSGLALKNGLHTMAGTIDSGYRGEYGVLLINLGSEPIEINTNDKIAQLIITPCWTVGQPKCVSKLTETDRGSGGYGSTGI